MAKGLAVNSWSEAHEDPSLVSSLAHKAGETDGYVVWLLRESIFKLMGLRTGDKVESSFCLRHVLASTLDTVGMGVVLQGGQRVLRKQVSLPWVPTRESHCDSEAGGRAQVLSAEWLCSQC